MKRRKRALAIACLLLTLLLVPLAWSVYREWKQAKLDFQLIEAIKARDSQKALEALDWGASGEARDTGKSPTFRSTLLNLLNRLWHPKKKDSKAERERALLLLFQLAVYNADSDNPDAGPDLTVVRALLDHGANINDQDSNGWSPLYYACFFTPNRDTVRLLLKRGADTELADHFGATPLMNADAKVTDILLEYGARIEAVNKDRRTALMFAVGRYDPEKVRVLLEHGAEAGTKDSDGMILLDYVRDEPFPNSRKIAALLRKYGSK